MEPILLLAKSPAKRKKKPATDGQISHGYMSVWAVLQTGNSPDALLDNIQTPVAKRTRISPRMEDCASGQYGEGHLR